MSPDSFVTYLPDRSLPPFARTCTLLAGRLRHYDEPGVSVAVLANGAPPASLIKSHGAQASV